MSLNHGQTLVSTTKPGPIFQLQIWLYDCNALLYRLAKWANLELKTLPDQRLGSLLLTFALPALTWGEKCLQMKNYSAHRDETFYFYFFQKKIWISTFFVPQNSLRMKRLIEDDTSSRKKGRSEEWIERHHQLKLKCDWNILSFLRTIYTDE